MFRIVSCAINEIGFNKKIFTSNGRVDVVGI